MSSRYLFHPRVTDSKRFLKRINVLFNFLAVYIQSSYITIYWILNLMIWNIKYASRRYWHTCIAHWLEGFKNVFHYTPDISAFYFSSGILNVHMRVTAEINQWFFFPCIEIVQYQGVLIGRQIHRLYKSISFLFLYVDLHHEIIGLTFFSSVSPWSSQSGRI